MVYVADTSRSEIYFAVHHCERFTHNFKHSHEKSILIILKYLKETSKDGKHQWLVVYSSKKMQVDWYIDADFSRLYVQEDHQDPVFVW